MRKFTIAIAAVILAWGTVGNAQTAMPDLTPASPQEETAAAEWLKVSGHAFDPSAYGEADLAPLAAVLARGQIIGIGEATHGDHQDQQFKTELIKQLVRMGKVQVLVLEANRDAGYRFDRYVRYGEGGLAQVVRNGSFFAIWKNDEFAGLLLWLRAWNLQSAQKVRIIGIDDQDAGRDAAFALGFIERFDKAAAKKLRNALGSLMPARGADHPRFYKWWLEAPRGEADSARLATLALRDWFDKAPARTRTDPDFSASRWAAETARQSYVIFEHERADADKAQRSAAYYARRDNFMAENAIGMLDPDERAVIWAHDSHVMEDVPQVYKDAGFFPLGTLIWQRIGDQYASLGFTWSQGSFRSARLKSWDEMGEAARSPSNEVVALPNNRPGEAGHLFDQTGAQAMWIEIATRPQSALLDAWARRPYWRGQAGWGVVEAEWQVYNDQVGDPPYELTLGHDVLVWFRTISPSHRWPTGPN